MPSNESDSFDICEVSSRNHRRRRRQKIAVQIIGASPNASDSIDSLTGHIFSSLYLNRPTHCVCSSHKVCHCQFSRRRKYHRRPRPTRRMVVDPPCVPTIPATSTIRMDRKRKRDQSQDSNLSGCEFVKESESRLFPSVCSSCHSSCEPDSDEEDDDDDEEVNDLQHDLGQEGDDELSEDETNQTNSPTFAPPSAIPESDNSSHLSMGDDSGTLFSSSPQPYEGVPSMDRRLFRMGQRRFPQNVLTTPDDVTFVREEQRDLAMEQGQDLMNPADVVMLPASSDTAHHLSLRHMNTIRIISKRPRR